MSYITLHQRLTALGPRLYVGGGWRGPAWAPPQQAVLVLGPPRSGKTTSLVIPNVLAAPGPVLATSTKPDVMEATLQARRRVGRCWLLDPTASVDPPPGVTRIAWSPVAAAKDWEEALVVTRGLVNTARPEARRGEAGHWTERSEALVAPLLHAASLAGGGMRQVLRWVHRHDLSTPLAILNGQGARIAADVVAGVAATEERERSGILSTAAGVLAAYRSSAALDASGPANIDPAALPRTRDTVYVCSPARSQAVAAPIVVAFLEQVRSGAYASRDRAVPTVFALDELANIAPLPDLPSMVSEGGGQGLLTLACLQDLSQARARWGAEAEGLMTLFGTKLLLPGIADGPTLDLVSRLGGTVDVPQRSTSVGPWWGPSRGAPTTTWSLRRQPRLPPDTISRLPPGTALAVTADRPPETVRLVPWAGKALTPPGPALGM